ncbi:MAG: hypothetical protein U9O98_08800 [Asgard group archaeon]|nr:hypothetical protein [Asgard group archaeon]
MNKTGIDLFNEAISSIKKNAFADAINKIKKILHHKKEFESIIPRNNYIFNEFQYLDDLSLCEKTIENGNQCYKAYLALSLIYKTVGNKGRAINFLEKAIEFNDAEYFAWRLHGQLAFQQGDIETAKDSFYQSLKINPEDVLSLEGVGLCYYYLDEPLRSLKPLQKALDINPKNHVILNRLAFINMEIGKLDEAHHLIKKALKLNKKKINYWDTLACILFLKEEHDKSLEIFEKILKKNPEDHEVSWHILANLYDSLGLHAKAKIIESKMPIRN